MPTPSKIKFLKISRSLICWCGHFNGKILKNIVLNYHGECKYWVSRQEIYIRVVQKVPGYSSRVGLPSFGHFLQKNATEFLKQGL